MGHFHFIKGTQPEFHGHDHKTEAVKFFHYLAHYIYAANEPALIRSADNICNGIENAKTPKEREKKIK